MPNSRRDRAWVGGFLVGALISGILIHGAAMRWPPSGPDWVGDTGIVASGAAILGVIGAAAAGIGVFLTNRRSQESLELARAAEAATRFQKGSEMLDGEVTAIAGIAILQQVATEQYASYRAPTLTTLASFIRKNDIAVVEELRKRVLGQPLGNVKRKVGDPKRSTLSALLAMGRILAAPPPFDDPLRDLIDGRYPVAGIYLGRTRIYEATLSNLVLEKVALDGVSFRATNFANTILNATAFSYVRFWECDMRGANFLIVEEMNSELRFIKCRNTEFAYLNGERLDMAIERRTEAQREYDAEMAERFPQADFDEDER